MADNQGVDIDKANRLKELRKALGLTQIEFGNRIGVTQGNIANFENARRPMGPNMDYKIVHGFNLNPEWWEKGVGAMVMDAQSKLQSVRLGEAPEAKNFSRMIPLSPFIFLPVFSFRRNADKVELVSDLSNLVRLAADEMEEYEYEGIVIQIDGNWMVPKLMPGNKVLAIPLHLRALDRIKKGVYALAYDNEFVVMRLTENELSENNTLIFSSENNESEITIRKDQIRYIWWVVRVIGEEVL